MFPSCLFAIFALLALLAAVVRVNAVPAAVRSLSSAYDCNCVLLDVTGDVRCFGYNVNGQLGVGDTNSRGDGPFEMGSNLSTAALGTGYTTVNMSYGSSAYHTCAIVASGPSAGLKCWGLNNFGQLGYEDTSDRGDNAGEMDNALPLVQLGSNVTGVVQVGTGLHYTCVLLEMSNSGPSGLKCFGRNQYGQLGYEDITNRGDGPGEMHDSLPFVDLGTGRTVTQLSSGQDFNCAVLDDASLKCFGLHT